MRRFGLCAAMFLLSAATTAKADAWAPSEATALYNEGHFLDAARAFEAAFRDSGRAGILYNAGLAREAAGPGNDALALLHWRRFLAEADDVTEAERDDLGRRIATAEARTAAVEFLYDGPASAHPQSVTLRRQGADEADRLDVDWPQDQAELSLHVDPGKWTVQILGPQAIAQKLSFHARLSGSEALRLAIVGTQPLEPVPVQIRLGPQRALRHGISLSWTGPTPAEHPKTRKAHAPSQKWTLPPGAWTLRASAKGYEPTESLVTISDQPVHLSIELESKVDWARVGLGAVSATAAISGAAMFGISRWQFAGKLDDYNLNTPPNKSETLPEIKERIEPTSDALRTNLSLQEYGAAVFGFGVGTATSTLLSLRPRWRTPREAWIETGLGSALIIGGSISYALLQKNRRQTLRTSDCMLVKQGGCMSDPNISNPLPLTSNSLHLTTSLPAISLLGIGGGLLVGGIVKQIVLRRRSRSSKLSFSLSPAQFGAQTAISGRF